MSKKIVLIDGNSIIYRAFFAIPLLNNNKGVYTNAVYGFTTMLLRIIAEEEPTHMLVAFDAGKTTFRHEAYKEYKGGRQKTPPELSEQFPLMKELLDAFQIKHYQLDLFEADDIIGTLAKEGSAAAFDVKVISGDQDLLQLVSDQVTVDLTRRGVSDVDSYTPAFLQDKMELNADQIIDLKALMGDKSDNIPGVPGVGIKTATRLLKEYKTLDNVYDHVEELSGKKLKENLLTYKEDAYLSKELVTLDQEAPLEIALDKLVFKAYDEAKVHDLFKELEFNSLLERLGVEAEEAEVLTEITYTVIDEVTTDLFTGDDTLVVEMITENYHTAPIEAIALVNKQGHYVMTPDVALQSDIFKQWAEDPAMRKNVFDAKALIVALQRHGIHLRGVTFDLLLTAYLLNPAENLKNITDVAHRFGEMNLLTDEEVYGKGAKLKVPEETILQEHVVRKATAISHLTEVMIDQLKDNDQYILYQDLEMPLALILAEMEHTGIKVDTATLEAMGEELTGRLAAIEAETYELVGEEFNMNSPQQLGVILFEKLELPIIKKTKTGYSTAADVLEKLEGEHAIIPKITLYRQLRKLQSTYIEGLLKVVHPDTHKIHTRFNQALTQTGRLSSTEPNLQNIPIRLEEGRKVRQAFVPAHDDWIIFAADYSQIELRVLAHIAQDEKLIEAFKQGRDIHTQTAQDVFHVGEGDVTETMRSQAKAVNFGIVYGMSDYGLSQNLGISRKEAKEFIDRYFRSYPGVQDYMKEIVSEAKRDGHVTTIMNRRRYLPEITSRNYNVRSFAERTAMNTPVQGSAADIIKKAMIDLNAALRAEDLQARILLQVHDELILEAPETELDRLTELVPAVMEQTVTLAVPLKVDYSSGKSWFEV